MSSKVFRVVSIGSDRNHHAIFVENNTDGTGTVFRVTGDFQNDMTFEEKPSGRPEDSPEFIDKTLLGWVAGENLKDMTELCTGNLPPHKQFDGPTRLNPQRPLRHQQEWTDETIDILMCSGVVRTKAPNSSST
ncbi:hypothetical protein B0J13DRAFT_619946 [Dactylonectria estremocensis]|uniref:Uncharacterized protein n=1 Tax=Dactylonectria estremocensis TaxID=1079267 RepID=A0A9P9JB99_9HYPO|nr:hypothetical protein B0J13DRAFT_619946 [Dactylonectria estremocensis]